MTDKIWVEQYRPEILDDIVGHDAVVDRMKSFVNDPAMPNLLFAGRQGIGKTAIVTAFAKEMYGDDWKRYLMEMNASDERGIDTIREKVKDFARTGSGEYDYKIIFLDEADQLTSDAQPALRRIMEDFHDQTRFILSCNYVNQIIDPIQSRCGVYRLTPLADEHIEVVLNRVVDGEGLEVEDEAIDRLVQSSRGDARSAINTLQALTLDGELEAEDVEEVLGVVEYQVVREIVETAISGELDEAMTQLDQDILKEGISVDDALETMLAVLKNTDEMSDYSKRFAFDAIGEADQRLREGANPHVQMHSLLANLLIARHNVTGDYDE